jgi:hypothetical protein
MFKSIATAFVVLFVCGHLNAGGVDPDNLKEYGRGIIKDYSDMKETDEIEWIWIAPGVRLSDYQFKVEPFENLTALDDRGMEEVFEDALPRTLKRAGSKKEDAEVLVVEGAIYWAQRASGSKRWIPYVGGHLGQAGLGIELVLKNAAGEIVAKIRHSGREGEKLESAAEELVDDVVRFVRGN